MGIRKSVAIAFVLVLCAAGTWVLGNTSAGDENTRYFVNSVKSDTQTLRASLAGRLMQGKEESLARLLREFFEERPGREELYASLVVLDTAGKVLCSYGPACSMSWVRGHNFSNYDGVRQALRRKTHTTMVLHTVAHGRSMRKGTVYFALAEHGRLVGILGVDFAEGTLNEACRITLEEFGRLQFS